jgi:RNA polymerase sigma factor for flagellar operon FliA
MTAWTTYKETGDIGIRNELMVQYLPLVKYVASKVAAGLPSNVEQDDLESYGLFGLIDAIEKFEPERGFKFETYAVPRIRGSILDELRVVDWVPRSTRARIKALDKELAAAEAYGFDVPHDDMAERLGMTEVQYRQVILDSTTSALSALEAPTSQSSEEQLTLADVVPDLSKSLDIADLDSLFQYVAGSIGELSERERFVLALYYFEGLTLAEIGAILGVTESRVCQIHTKACRGIIFPDV